MWKARKTKKTCPLENINILGANMGPGHKGKRENKYGPLSSIIILPRRDKPAVIPKYVTSSFARNASFSPFCVCEVCTTVWALRMGNVHHSLSSLAAGHFQYFGGSANSTKHLKMNYLMDAYSTRFGFFYLKFQRQQNILQLTNSFRNIQTDFL